jgi:O-Antigen ligase
MAETTLPPLTASSTPRTGRSNVGGYLVAFAIVGSALQGISLPYNLLPVDVIFVLILWITIGPLLTAPDLAARRFRRAVPFLWLLLLGQLLSLFGKGLSNTALIAMGKLLVPVVVFFGVWLLLARRRRWEVLAIRAVKLTGLCVAVDTLIEGDGLRATGTFGNPNYAGHFLACVVVVLWVLPCRFVTRVVLTGVCLAALYRTGSFGAILFLGSAAAYWVWGRSTRLEPSARVAARIAIVLLVSVSAPFIYQELSGTQFEGDNGVSSQRLNKSSASRFELWSEGLSAYESHPLGVGVRSFVSSSTGAGASGYNEVHNDAIKFLVETGPLALAGAFGIIVIVWGSGRAGGPTRVLLTGLIASSMVREVWSFRHAWVILAVVAAWETTYAQPIARHRLNAAGQQGP